MPSLGGGLVWPCLVEPPEGPDYDGPEDGPEADDECSRWAMLVAIEPAEVRFDV